MKILHTSDWHIGDFPGPECNGQNRRLIDIGMCINHLHSVAIEEQPDVALICGDIFHTAQVWANRGLNEARRAILAIEALSEICPVVVLRGTPNHDGDEQFNMLKTYFMGNNNVEIITEPRPVYMVGLQIAALPGFDRGVFRAKFPGISREEENQLFTEELGKLVLSLRAQCDPKIPSVLISHYTVPGCNMESGQTQFFAGVEPVILPEVLDAAAFDLVALGHIHRPQQLKSCKNTFYSGGINALNFNDEGQERGFWIHALADCKEWEHKFIQTPYREFYTIRLDDDSIFDLNSGDPGNADLIAHNYWRGMIDDKIVRVIYTCTEENNKAFVHASLEKQLYADGAFWVSEILPEKVYPAANRKGLSEKADPETNLVQYLEEKGYAEADMSSIIEAARPIIAKAMSSETASRYTGIFEPVSIEVKNYRNYVDESFDFTNISFCTINGKNGAGKSSLFMDAILDCLYEEPREGDLTGWIRSDESARSGAITFTFRIGSNLFRVSRTRAKSGKATLNIAELVDGDWFNRSNERIKDTQDEIVNILGMDSLTLKSCALIMQDQYGLFLEADKESRMAILGKILDLGIYGDMEMYARDASTDVNREINQRNILIKSKLEQTGAEGTLKAQLEQSNADMQTIEKAVLVMEGERDLAKESLAAKEQARKEADSLRNAFTLLHTQMGEIEAARQRQQSVIQVADDFLAKEAEILAGVATYHRMLQEEKDTIASVTTYGAKSAELQTVNADIARTTTKIGEIEDQQADIRRKVAPLQERLSRESELKDAAQEYSAQKANLDTMESKAATHISLSTSISNLRQQYSEQRSAYSAEAATRAANVNGLEAKVALLDSSNCPYPDKSTCSFLADAREAKKEYTPYVTSCTEWKETEKSKLAEIQTNITNLEKQQDSLGYDPQAAKLLRETVSSLEQWAREYESLSAIREQIDIYNNNLQSLVQSCETERRQLSELEDKQAAIRAELSRLKDVVTAHSKLQADIVIAKKWLDSEKQLPVEREKRANAVQRFQELTSQRKALESEILDTDQEIQKKDNEALDIDAHRQSVNQVEQEIVGYRAKLDTLKLDTGGLMQQLKTIGELKESIAAMQTELNELAVTAAHYDLLKVAFSQDGIPHNIICSIVPNLTAIANKILGQMTGGHMGMEFRTEKMLKNNKKEVVTLDIFIEEYGNGSLPYRSKSGGEKVKSALSAILALAEIKSTTAGIQLGMLFIDEPPFLDGDGIQAYCDALETIRSRYHGLKVMAITHDPTMKARFPQSLDVIKTEEGSKVVLD